ncbi:hypothetical protein SORBI_3008G024550 [Sorghum bicolor]|uniref:Uncharacterized protein n=1 Tax=Sorghum bicolor TaxID=4558 RepID=A0A1Z5R4F9_SORBI|nr:hypothetical protein SORBI_3008G024550 [Sorghum bicolor]
MRRNSMMTTTMFLFAMLFGPLPVQAQYTVGRHQLMDSKSVRAITASSSINSTSSSDERKVVGQRDDLLLLSGCVSERELPLEDARVQVKLCDMQAQMPTSTSAISSTSIVMQN